MKQNVLKNTVYSLMDISTVLVLYLVFPIMPLYVFLVLLAMVTASSILKRYGLATAIIITYVIITFITTLGHASLLIMPFLLLTYLITEAGIINDIAIISWALLFTPLYWLSIPLSIIPSTKGYSIRSVVVFSLLSLLYAIAAAYQGIMWIPITVMHTANLSITYGIRSLLFGNSGNPFMMYNELNNLSLYLAFIIIIATPSLVSRYLSRLVMLQPLNNNVAQVIMNISPQLITTSLLYAPLVSNAWNYEATPLFIVGSLIIGSLMYILDILQSNAKIRTPLLHVRRKISSVIPITDPLMITEYSYWAKKLPKDDVDFVNTVINTLSKTGITALSASLSQDKMEIISKVLFGLTRTKGFIIKGDVGELPDDVNWFIRTHEKSLLIIIPNEINKNLISKLIDYNKRTKLHTLIINSNYSALNRLRKYGIEIVNYTTAQGNETEHVQTKYINEEQNKQDNAVESNISVTSINNNVSKEVAPQVNTNVTISTVNTNNVTKAISEDNVKESIESAISSPKESATSEERPLELPKPQVTESKSETTRERPKAKSKNVSSNMVITLDPVDLIDMNTRSKLIDYIDSSVRLRDMMDNLGLKYIVSILVIGPSRSGKTALINHVAKHLNIPIIDYKDPSVSIVDNAIIHVPNLEKVINEDMNHILKLLNIAKSKHLVIVFESINPWSIDIDFIRKNIDVVIPILPVYEDYADEIVQSKLKVGGKDQEIIKGIIKSCPAVEAIDKIRLYLSSRDGTSIICEDTFKKYQDFAQSLAFK
ncbi:MAG: hypothetical protein ACP5GZ_00300 [Vulcanisaeta sp.]|uniref:hypothetical protein n=1 Tax=Vulcanisaeta sp. TaxID=2020871 RepID=UPI003D0FA0AA